jgi:hypothetical protein
MDTISQDILKDIQCPRDFYWQALFIVRFPSHKILASVISHKGVNFIRDSLDNDMLLIGSNKAYQELSCDRLVM